jgi:hypothetical protein
LWPAHPLSPRIRREHFGRDRRHRGNKSTVKADPTLNALLFSPAPRRIFQMRPFLGSALRFVGAEEAMPCDICAHYCGLLNPEFDAGWR